MSIGHAIKQARSERGLTQQQLANRAGISMTSLYYIESDTNSPSVRTLSKIAAALEVPVSALCEDCTKAQSTEADCNNDSDDSNITSFPAG